MALNPRSSQTVCDSLFCSIAVVAPLALSLAYYRDDLRQLLRILFLAAVLFGIILTVRHSVRLAQRRLKRWLGTGKKEGEEDRRRSSLCDLYVPW